MPKPTSTVLRDPVKKAPVAPMKSQNPLDSGNPLKGTRAPKANARMKPAGRNPFLEITKPGGKL